MPKRRVRWLFIVMIAAVAVIATGSSAQIKKTKDKKTKTESNQEEDSDDSDIETYDQKLSLLSALVQAEVGDLSDDCQIATASVVLNRVNQPIFPDTVYDVIYQPGQYETVDNGRIDNEPDENVIKNVEYVLENGSQIPDNVIYQGMFSQGSGVWDIIDGEYFCYK